MTKLDDILRVRKPAPAHPVIAPVAVRWSPRFYSGEKIPREHLDTMFEAARWAPSAHNRQPWQFFFTEKGSDHYGKIFSALNGYNQSWAGTAPVLVLACAETKAGGKANQFCYYDLGAAVLAFVLQAQALGYHARQMGLFDREKVRKFFRLKPDLEPFIVIAVGRIGNYEEAPDAIVKMELDPRPRKTGIATELK
ncbi:hypothetical protein A2Z33_05810 [Candidatus Gottesmanbacteria bacterium RBG_16_52_11]|uniref:Nitroreductase domain-containing protein n=1 Tax=Candidatus Gottesmanbacteria bacterium RBG_16_52_11 TaxID=1798374 RepID=A0A1F5YXV4_9BACT|nr:MAG: hypothetical protein A2Z33_05810 [Candidatus Gottesmanbacteria bacterium RBG_16_52_11]